MDFAATNICTSRAHCGLCRDADAGREARTMWASHFTTPGGAVDFDCPFDIDWGAPQPLVQLTYTPATPAPHPPTWGPPLWAILHTATAPTAEWLAAMGGRIPCGECRIHWRDILARTPPDFSSVGKFFSWTVAAHNTVNARLGKPTMSEADARAKWQPPAKD